MKLLIVTADDFGLTPSVNAGVRRGHEEGIVTSASLMVRGPAAEEAAQLARECPMLAVGLHVDLAEWVHVEGEWQLRYEVVPEDDEAQVHAEVERQLRAFEALVGRAPTHLDSHQHVHRGGHARAAVSAAGASLGVPVRDVTEAVRYSGAFYGQDGRGYPVPESITVMALVRIIEDLEEGITELGCHPATAADVDDVYCQERPIELRALCDERVRGALSQAGVTLASFLDIA